MVKSKDGRTCKCPKPNCKEKTTARIGDIGIAEVLRTCHKNEVYLWIAGDGFWSKGEMAHQAWNLEDDNLDHQKPETIDFLFSLIP